MFLLELMMGGSFFTLIGPQEKVVRVFLIEIK
jgi:hypothetical protein